MTEQEMINAGCPPALARKIANQHIHEFSVSPIFGIPMCSCGAVILADHSKEALNV